MIKNSKVSLKILIGIVLIIGGTAMMIHDWNTGSGHFEYASSFSRSYFSFLICIAGASILPYNRKKDLPKNRKAFALYVNKTALFAFAFAALLVTVLYGYSYLFILPKIEKEGVKTKAIVTKAYKKVSTDNYGRVVDYEYYVNGRTYKRTVFNKKFNKGDYVLIRYSNKKPNFHIIE